MKVFLSDISEILVGYQSREGIRAYPDGSHFLLQARDFNTLHQVDWSNLTRFTPIGSTTKPEIRQGDVLFLAKGQDNFACPIFHVATHILAANSFYILRPDNATILPDYLAWWLSQASAQEYIQLNRSGSSLPFLSVSALSHLEISVPDFEMQRKISELELLRKKEADLLGLYLSKNRR